ncbi:MAG TPA: phosphoserine phosphatase SerB [Burkholderiales bacterium]|nr:phosphoserine phosphatase SerB [Burkholderiales bacterium]
MNLVIQGPSLTESQARKLGAVERITDRAWRIRGATSVDSAYCERNRIDHALVADGRRFADLKLVAMDMDSTLITMETIDELGDLVGKKPEIAAITARAMRGEIDYPESLRQRVALLKGMDEKGLLEVYENRLRLTAGAETLLAACKRHGVKTLLVSGGFTFFVERLKERLGIDYTISNTLEIANGRLTGRVLGDIVDAEAKAAKFLQLAKSLQKEQTVAIGDGANDLRMMAEAGLSIAFHAKPVVRAQASCAISWCGLDAVPNLFE